MRIFLFLFITLAFIAQQLKAQTSGNLTFSVTTTEPTGGYSGKHVIAIWIKDLSGNFIKTKVKYAATREQYLNQWITNSGRNTVDAVTGATLSNHGTLSVSWNGTNAAGSPVPDGTYQVWMQMADANTNGQTASVSFVKGSSAMQLSPANVGNFTSMSLNWKPTTTDLQSIETRAIEVYPNPTHGIVNVLIVKTDYQDEIVVTDISGKVILTHFITPNSENTIRFDLSNFGKGTYFIRNKNSHSGEIQKIVVH